MPQNPLELRIEGGGAGEGDSGGSSDDGGGGSNYPGTVSSLGRVQLTIQPYNGAVSPANQFTVNIDGTGVQLVVPGQVLFAYSKIVIAANIAAFSFLGTGQQASILLIKLQSIDGIVRSIKIGSSATVNASCAVAGVSLGAVAEVTNADGSNPNPIASISSTTQTTITATGNSAVDHAIPANPALALMALLDVALPINDLGGGLSFVANLTLNLL